MIQTNTDLLLTLSLVICIVAAARALYLQKAAAKYKKNLQEAITSLTATQRELADLRQNEQKKISFNTDLNQAELTTRLQESRLGFNRKYHDYDSPDRYHYIHSLKEKGLSSADIATILSISLQEAEQLVTLAGLVKK